MTSLLLWVLLLLQTTAPSALVRVSGRISIEGGGDMPSSFTLPLVVSGGGPAPAAMTIRPQIDGSFRTMARPGEYRLGEPGGLPPGYTLQLVVYDGVDLLRSPLKISPDSPAELLISLAVKGPSPAVRVSGRVTGIAPGQVTRIALREPVGGDLPAALETSVGPDGTFTFPKVLPGRYIVYTKLRTRTQITVGNTDVTDVIVAHPQDILVSGHVITEGPPPSITPAVLVEGNGEAAGMQNRATGTFILSLRNGENAITVRNIPDGYRLKSMTYGDVDLQKQPLELDGPATWDIIVRLQPVN